MAVHPKVASAGLAGAVVTLVVAALAAYGIDVPPAVSAAVVTLVSFAAGYLRSAPTAA